MYPTPSSLQNSKDGEECRALALIDSNQPPVPRALRLDRMTHTHPGAGLDDHREFRRYSREGVLTNSLCLQTIFFNALPFSVLLVSLRMVSPLPARIPSIKPAKRKALSRPLVVSLAKRKRGGSVHLGANLHHWVREQTRNYSLKMPFCFQMYLFTVR